MALIEEKSRLKEQEFLRLREAISLKFAHNEQIIL